jgi:hypothetical protein
MLLVVRSIVDLVIVLVLVAQWCQGPVDALAVLETQDLAIQSDLTSKM